MEDLFAFCVLIIAFNHVNFWLLLLVFFVVYGWMGLVVNLRFHGLLRLNNFEVIGDGDLVVHDLLFIYNLFLLILYKVIVLEI